MPSLCVKYLVVIALPLGMLLIPAPVNAKDTKATNRVLILPPINEANGKCGQPPSQKEILEGLQKSIKNVRDFKVQYRKTRDRVHPPRFFPKVGLAQLHECDWRCDVSFTEVIESALPFPIKIKIPRREVVYFGRDHLHRIPN